MSTLANGLEAVTFDFGNTLVPVSAAGLAAVVEATARDVAANLGPFDVDRFVAVWRDERDRQFAEDVPAMREVDLEQRMLRVVARLRGMAAPSRDDAWDDALAGEYSRAEELQWAVEAYSRAFVDVIPAPAGVEPLLARLAKRFRLAILSNWPLAVTIDRFAAAAGWEGHLTAIVVSQRVGAIKPHPAIFRAAEELLGVPPGAILHVGDDWAADVVGAHRVGWRTALLRARPDDSPLPWGGPAMYGVRADVEIDSLDELADLLEAEADRTAAGGAAAGGESPDRAAAGRESPGRATAGGAAAGRESPGRATAGGAAAGRGPASRRRRQPPG